MLLRRMVSLCLCGCLVAALLTAGTEAAAARQTLRLEQAQRLAISANAQIKKTYNKLVVKQMKYVEAVKAIKAKVKNLRSFRWSPLLSFKLPEKLDLIEEYDLNIKPLVLQAEIATIKHQLLDLRYEVMAQVTKQFIDVYIGQEKIAFTREMLAAAREELSRNSARLVLGLASQNDVDTMTKTVDTLTNDLAQLMRSFESAKKELGDQIKLDVSTGYNFANPLRTVEVPREQLSDIIKYTMENDQTYYEARMTLSTARLNLEGYERLMRSQYGDKMSAITIFVNTAKQGGEIDTDAFKRAYDAMLINFDKPWDGKVKILFFTFTMEWFKGEVSGTRYVEDEMYALYNACLEYLAALKDKEAAEKALRKSVELSFESLVTAKRASDAMMEAVAQDREMLDRLLALNKLGKASFDEVNDKRSDFQSLQLEAVDTLGSYNELLYDFDRLTCGAITPLLTGAGVAMDTGEGADSVVDKPHYYIYTDIADLVFVFGVDIPEDFEPAVTAFEIWYEGTQIGSRTPIEEQLRHLALDYGETAMLTVRLFNEDEYVDECEVDTTIPRDILDIKGAVAQKPPPDRIAGSYKVSTVLSGNVSTSSIAITVVENSVKYYSLSYGENGIHQSKILPAEEAFSYLTLLIASIQDVTVSLYDKDQAMIMTGYFQPEDQTIRIPRDQDPQFAQAE